MTEENKMIFHIKVLEITDLPTMKTLGQLNPYLLFKLNTSTEYWKTRIHLSLFDEICHIPVTLKKEEQLIIELYSQNLGKDTLISTIKLNVRQFPVGEVLNQWYTLKPEDKKNNGGGKVHFIFHLDKPDQPPFLNQ